MEKEVSEFFKENLINEEVEEIELKIISGMLENLSLISYAVTRLNVDDFDNSVLRIFFKEIIELYKENEKVINLTIIKERVENNRLILVNEQYDNLLNKLKYSIAYYNLDEFKKLVDIKKCQSIQSSLVQFSQELLNIHLTTSTIEDKLGQLNANFFQITSSWVTNIEGKDTKILLDAFQEDLNNKAYDVNQINEEKYNSDTYNWCLKSVKSLLNKFDGGLLYVLAARPGIGKTTLALNWAVALSKKAYEINVNISAEEKKHKVLFFSLEMSAEQMFDKVISLLTYCDNNKIKKRALGVEKAGILSSLNKQHLRNLPIIFFDEGNLTLAKIESIVKEYTAKYCVDFVVIDYLQLIKVTDDKLRFNTTRANEVAIISKAIKTMALSLNIPILALSQLSRRVEGNGTKDSSKKPLLSDLRESGSIEQDADVVMFLYTDDEAKKYDTTTKTGEEVFGITFAIEKNRFGPRGVRELLFHKYCSRFEDDNIKPELNGNDD